MAWLLGMLAHFSGSLSLSLSLSSPLSIFVSLSLSPLSLSPPLSIFDDARPPLASHIVPALRMFWAPVWTSLGSDFVIGFVRAICDSCLPACSLC